MSTHSTHSTRSTRSTHTRTATSAPARGGSAKAMIANTNPVAKAPATARKPRVMKVAKTKKAAIIHAHKVPRIRKR